VWDVWDNVSHSWVSTRVPVILSTMPGTPDHPGAARIRQWLLFQSITLNGQVHNINKYYAPGSAPSNWWGITVNYQMDGNHDQASYTTYLDNSASLITRKSSPRHRGCASGSTLLGITLKICVAHFCEPSHNRGKMGDRVVPPFN